MISIERGILIDKNERMKDQLLNEEYVFCEICEDFEYRESGLAENICNRCFSCVCNECDDDF